MSKGKVALREKAAPSDTKPSTRVGALPVFTRRTARLAVEPCQLGPKSREAGSTASLRRDATFRETGTSTGTASVSETFHRLMAPAWVPAPRR